MFVISFFVSYYENFPTRVSHLLYFFRQKHYLSYFLTGISNSVKKRKQYGLILQIFFTSSMFYISISLSLCRRFLRFLHSAYNFPFHISITSFSQYLHMAMGSCWFSVSNFLSVCRYHKYQNWKIPNKLGAWNGVYYFFYFPDSRAVSI